MPGMLKTWDTAMKLLTDFTGKHHSNVSFVIAQNISKVLSDVFRLSSRRVLDITNRVSNNYALLTRFELDPNAMLSVKTLSLI